VTIGLSVVAHGITAAPLAKRYAGWYESHPRERLPAMESVGTPDHRTRGAPNPDWGWSSISPTKERRHEHRARRSAP